MAVYRLRVARDALRHVHPARAAEEVHWEGEGLVVDEAYVAAEQPVEQDDVAAAVAHLDHVVEGLALPLLLLCDEEVTEAGEKEAVAEVAEHDAEEEGEHDAREGSRVGLAIARDAVRVDERLEAQG